jgi:hypothetical protein
MHVRDLLRRFEAIQAKKIAEADEELGKGKASSMEDYKRRCGVNQGRRDAVSDLRALIDDISKDEDDDQ